MQWDLYSTWWIWVVCTFPIMFCLCYQQQFASMSTFVFQFWLIGMLSHTTNNFDGVTTQWGFLHYWFLFCFFFIFVSFTDLHNSNHRNFLLQYRVALLVWFLSVSITNGKNRFFLAYREFSSAYFKIKNKYFLLCILRSHKRPTLIIILECTGTPTAK